jgi:hypothetical protein
MSIRLDTAHWRVPSTPPPNCGQFFLPFWSEHVLAPAGLDWLAPSTRGGASWTGLVAESGSTGRQGA